MFADNIPKKSLKKQKASRSFSCFEPKPNFTSDRKLCGRTRNFCFCPNQQGRSVFINRNTWSQNKLYQTLLLALLVFNYTSSFLFLWIK